MKMKSPGGNEWQTIFSVSKVEQASLHTLWALSIT